MSFGERNPNKSPNPTPESKLALRGIVRAASGRLNRYPL